MLTFENVGKTFPNGTVALRDFSLAIVRGEFVGLVGPSGCGKSTVLRLAANLSLPSSGGVTVAATARKRGAIGLVFQEPTLMPWATVLNNVTMPLKLMGVSKADREERARNELRSVDLHDRAGQYPRHLSGGMRMRVSIARALVSRPDILLMDEPFAALDEITRFSLNDDLRALHDNGALTTLFVTHSIYEAVYLSDRVVVMSADGAIAGEISVSPEQPRDPHFRHTRYFTQKTKEIADLLASASRDEAISR